MTDTDPDMTPAEGPDEEAPMWKPKDPAQMVQEAETLVGVEPAVAPGEPHPHEAVWIRHSSGLGDPQVISEHNLADMEAQGWEEMTDRPRLVEGPGGALIAKARPASQEAPDGGEGEDE